MSAMTIEQTEQTEQTTDTEITIEEIDQFISDLTALKSEFDQGTESRNGAAIQIDQKIAYAVSTGNADLLTAAAEAIGRKKGDAMLTHMARLGDLLNLPTDLSKDPVRNLDLDPEGKTVGEAYWVGRVRKGLTVQAKATGLKPKAVMEDLLDSADGENLPDALAKIEEWINAPKGATLIENYFTAGKSIKKATDAVLADDYEGDLHEAVTRADEMIVLLGEFLKASGQ